MEISTRKPHFLGVALAGGASTRFGAPKAFATVDDLPIVRRVIQALVQVASSCVIAAGTDPEVYEGLGVEVIMDRFPRRGPMAGLHAALIHARDHGFDGICCIPCDAPFAAPRLIRELTASGPGYMAVLPASRGPLGYEPLFGWYSVDVLPDIEYALAHNDLALHRLLETLDSVAVLPLQKVARFGDPDALFFNVNTPGDLMIAREIVLGMKNG